VLIDVQRMTTTLTTAMAEGAERVRVFREIEEVQVAAAEYEPAARLCGGERHGQQIDGFDGDNSPRAYLRSELDLSGKTLLFTTTNGSKAAQFVKHAAELVLGSFVNLQAVRRACLSRGLPVLLVCSGTAGERSDEDELFAGVVALQLLRVRGQGDMGTPVQGEVADPLTLEIVQRTATILSVQSEVTVAGQPLSADASRPTEHVTVTSGGGLGQHDAVDAVAALEKTIRTSTNGLMLAKIGLVEDFEVILDVDRYGSTLPTYDQATDSFMVAK
jgi:phosphosulfolactate phosphohydrolase-like enzyme